MDNRNDLYSLELNLKKELDENKEDMQKMKESERDDYLYELVDSYNPLYTARALEIAQNDLWLAVDTPDMDCRNAFDCIISNINTHLREIADSWLKDNITSN